MTEQEARNFVNTTAQALLRLGMTPENLGKHTLKIREIAKGDPQKTVDGFKALIKRVREVLNEQGASGHKST